MFPDDYQQLLDLIFEYGGVMWREGFENRHHDNIEGDAQRVWSEIENLFKKPAKKKIKLEAWIDVCGELRWFSERKDSPENCHVRLPSEDKFVEVEE